MSTTTASTNATWNSETNTFAWTAENEYIVIPGLSGDLTGCYLDFTISGGCHLDIVDTDDHVMNGGWNGYGRFGSGGSKTQDLGFMVSGSSCDITKVKEVRICSQNASGSITVTAVSYYYPVIPIFNSEGVATINLKSLVASGGFTFDPSTGVVTSDGKSTGRLSLEFSAGVNLTGLKRYDVNITGSDATIWRCIVKSQGTDVLGYYGSKWGNNLTPEERAKAISVNEFFWESKSAEDLGKVTAENLTFTINSITLTANKMNVVDAHDVPIATLPHYSVASDGTVSLGSTISTNYGINTDSPLGDGADDNDEYIDISEYDELRIYASSFETNHPRVFFFNADPIVAGSSATKGVTVYLNDAIFNYNSTEGYYYATISAIKGKCNGLAKVIGVKKNSYSAPAITINKIQVYKANPTYDYVLSGQYSPAVDISAVTSNASATAIDCTGLSGNNVNITSTNKNCMFKANSGVLSNPNNVIVDGTCANLALSDGYPFKTPAAFTATAVSYNRSFTADNMTTVCLPFALTSDEASALGTFYELSSVDGTVITFSEVAEPAANTPYLVIPTGTPLSIGGKSIAATPAETKSSASNIEFIGTLAATEIPASEGSNNYYAFNNGKLVRIAVSSATLPAFRAYIKATGDVGVKAFTIQFDDATGVNSLPSMDVAASSKFNVQSSKIFNVAGQRMSKLQKGLNIVNGQKVMVK